MKNQKVAFLHPPVSDDTVSLLADAMQEQLDVLCLNEREHHGALPVNKEEALAATYWLLAQSTPVQRGGSAHANLMLEHLAHRLQEQGYDYEVPYTKDGTDLWAEAATTDLDVFKEHFVNKHYFDVNLTDEKVRSERKKLESVSIPKPHLPKQEDIGITIKPLVEAPDRRI